MIFSNIENLLIRIPGSLVALSPLVYWLTALFLSFGLSIRYAKSCNLDQRRMVFAGISALLGVFCCYSLIDLLAHTSDYFNHRVDPIFTVNGGKGVFGALLGASLFSGLYLWWKKVSLLKYGDAAVPAIILGYSVARIGCFFNGCCFGIISDVPWAVRFPQYTLVFHNHWSREWVQWKDALSLPVHPTQLYHAIGGLILFFLLSKWQGRWTGSRMALGLASYGFLRFFLQFMRGDRTPAFGFLDINQIVSLILMLIAGLLWWQLGIKQNLSRKVIPAIPKVNTNQSIRL